MTRCCFRFPTLPDRYTETSNYPETSFTACPRALSRGASQALFVETSVEGRGLLRTNIEAFGLQGRAKIFRRDATDLGPAGTMQPFHFLFADPPYEKGLGEAAFGESHKGGWLVPGALAILEERANVDPSVAPAYVFLDSRSFGDTRMHFYRYQP